MNTLTVDELRLGRELYASWRRAGVGTPEQRRYAQEVSIFMKRHALAFFHAAETYLDQHGVPVVPQS